MNNLAHLDPLVAQAVEAERIRSEESINLIASENYTYPAVLEATGSVFTNKYAEGYPGRRYYAGCAHVDEVEELARERCKKLFNAEHANVQPHSGSQANMAVYFALLKPGDTILGMNLAAGGHLTHGYPINFSGTYYNRVNYGVSPDTEQFDFDEIRKLALEHKPKLIVCGASAYARTIDFAAFSKIAKEVGAYLMADIAHIAGPVAAGLHPSPFPHADVVTSTTHKTLRGPRGGIILCKAELAAALDKAVMPGIQGGPLMHHIAAKAVAFGIALQPTFKLYQQQILRNARHMAESFTKRGYRIVSNTTDNHLLVVDLRNKNITGKDAEQVLESIGIYANRNCIPFDPQTPFITSGIRLGTPALTTRGFKEQEIEQVVHFIDTALTNKDNPAMLNQLKTAIKALCLQFPIYPEMTPAQKTTQACLSY